MAEFPISPYETRLILPEWATGVLVCPDLHSQSAVLESLIRTAEKLSLFFVSLGDHTDRGPDPAGVLRLLKQLVESGRGAFVKSNHDEALRERLRSGSRPPKPSLLLTLAKLAMAPDANDLVAWFTSAYDRAPSIARLPLAAFAHAAWRPVVAVGISTDEEPDPHESLKELAIYGQTDGSIDSSGYPTRLLDWTEEVPSDFTVYVGHQILSRDAVTVTTNTAGGSTVHLDTGCGFEPRIAYAICDREGRLLDIVGPAVYDSAPAPARSFIPDPRDNPKTAIYRPDLLDTVFTPGARRLASIFTLAGFQIRAVGGPVRDALLGITPKDIDFATDARPWEILEVLERAGVRSLVHAYAHGTIGALMDGEVFEISSLRLPASDQSQQIPVWTDSFAEDAFGRDFIMNALSMDAQGYLHDYANGLDDITHGRVRFIGSATDQLNADPLRALRFFRFNARSPIASLDPDAEALSAIIDHPELEAIAAERVWRELVKLIAGPRMAAQLKLLRDTGLADRFGFPKGSLSDHAIEKLDRWRQKGLPGGESALLFPLLNSTKQVERSAERWKWSNTNRQRHLFLVMFRAEIAACDLRALKRSVVDGREKTDIELVLRLLDRDEDADALAAWSPPDFPIAAAHLLAAGCPQGPALGIGLKRLRAYWANEDFRPSLDDLLRHWAKTNV